jgi:hypothetical protein
MSRLYVNNFWMWANFPLRRRWGIIAVGSPVLPRIKSAPRKSHVRVPFDGPSQTRNPGRDFQYQTVIIILGSVFLDWTSPVATFVCFI